MNKIEKPGVKPDANRLVSKKIVLEFLLDFFEDDIRANCWIILIYEFFLLVL